MKFNKYDIILGILILAEIALCIYIGVTGKNNYLCAPGSGCDYVQGSIYGTLFGIKLAWFGVLCFSVLLILFLIARVKKNFYWMFFLASLVGAGLAIYFMSLQAFVLKEFCKNCMVIDGVMFLMFVIVLFEFIDFRKEIRSLEYQVEKVASRAL